MASGKIMIVDDDRNICELLRLYIEKEGFETAIANDGKAAVQDLSLHIRPGEICAFIGHNGAG